VAKQGRDVRTISCFARKPGAIPCCRLESTLEAGWGPLLLLCARNGSHLPAPAAARVHPIRRNRPGLSTHSR
jgi:hypothetical protein